MRSSQLYFPTLKEIPSDAEIVSHKLMLRAGLIRKLASGLYTWLPLGLRVLRKVEKIIREEMNRIHAQEILMPAIQPAELWIETARWDQFGPSLLKFLDRHKRYFCYGPTHEEVATDLIRHELKSYKQLPLILYQIQTKFRDEVRPRFGIMRAREFLMKDAYSFHIDEASLDKTYQDMYGAYSRIFTRLGLTFRAVLADTGSIGGSKSHEFQVLAESGEDLIAFSTDSDYAANVELAPSLPATAARAKPSKALSFVKTPNIKSVQEQADFLKMEAKDILKTLLVKGRTTEHPIVALLLRGNDELNPLKAEKLPLVFSPFTMASIEDVHTIAGCGPGFVGPKEISVPIIADHQVLQMVDFVCGANQEDTHYSGFNWGRDAAVPEAADLRFVKMGDKSPDGKGTLILKRGIEVGHIFQLGRKYSQAMNASVLDETGRAITVTMGSYGIGVSRIVAAAIEQHHDEKGICFPAAMAPFQVAIIPIGFHKSELVRKTAEALYANLSVAGIEVLLDDRDERPGVMFNDAELIGIPHRVVIGEKSLAENKVEYKGRQEVLPALLPLTDIQSFLQGLLA